MSRSFLCYFHLLPRRPVSLHFKHIHILYFFSIRHSGFLLKRVIVPAIFQSLQVKDPWFLRPDSLCTIRWPHTLLQKISRHSLSQIGILRVERAGQSQNWKSNGLQAPKKLLSLWNHHNSQFLSKLALILNLPLDYGTLEMTRKIAREQWTIWGDKYGHKAWFVL